SRSARAVAALSAPHGQPLFPVQPVDSFMVHRKSLALQQSRKPPVSETLPLAGQLAQPPRDNVCHLLRRFSPHRRSSQTGQPASAAFTDSVLPHGSGGRGSFARRRQKFFPNRSFSTTLS